jgi:hypothetical protein
MASASPGSWPSLRLLPTAVPVGGPVVTSRPGSKQPIHALPQCPRHIENNHPPHRARPNQTHQARTRAAATTGSISEDNDASAEANRAPILADSGPMFWGPLWDHALCATLNDLRVCARHARPQIGHVLLAT